MYCPFRGFRQQVAQATAETNLVRLPDALVGPIAELFNCRTLQLPEGSDVFTNDSLRGIVSRHIKYVSDLPLVLEMCSLVRSAAAETAGKFVAKVRSPCNLVFVRSRASCFRLSSLKF